MIKLVLIDDEQPALDELEYILSMDESLEIIGAFTDTTKALAFIREHQPEVVFLDISMPVFDGITLADLIRGFYKDIHIVFTTAYEEYAVKAFEMEAVDYVLKPLSEERLARTIQRIKSKMIKIDKNIEGHLTAKGEVLDKIAVWDKDRIKLIDVESIKYLSVNQGQTSIITENGNFKSHETLGKMETLLVAHKFFRCHRSYLINLNQIKEIIPWFNNTYAIRFQDIEEAIPVSRRQIKEFREILKLTTFKGL